MEGAKPGHQIGSDHIRYERKGQSTRVGNDVGVPGQPVHGHPPGDQSHG